MNAVDSVWETLGLAPTRDVAEIRRAYAKKVRVTRPEDDSGAFQILRAAFEAALAYAEYESLSDEPPRGGASGSEAAFAKPCSNARESAALAESCRLSALELHTTFAKLQTLLREGGTASHAELLAASQALIDAIHGADIEIAAECESLLAQWLVDSGPRADALIPTIANKLGWLARASDWNANAIFETVIQRAGALEFLRALESRSTAMAKALCLLRAPQPAWRYRLALARDASLEQTIAQLLHYIHSARPTALSLLNRDALSWWNSYFERARSRPHGFDLFWLAASLSLPVMAIVSPVSVVIDSVICLMIALSVLWAIWVRKPSRLGAQESRWLRPSLSVLFNLPIGLWWGVALANSDAPTDGRVAVAIAGTLLAFAFARRRLIEWWMLRLDAAGRRWTQGAMTVIAFISLAAAVGTDQQVTESAVAAVITAIVLLHRMPASQLNAAETRRRICVTLGTWTALAALLSLQKLDELAILRMGAVLFSAGVLITLALCLSGETPEADALRLRNREIS